MALPPGRGLGRKPLLRRAGRPGLSRPITQVAQPDVSPIKAVEYKKRRGIGIHREMIVEHDSG